MHQIVAAPMPTGSGAIVVHRALEECISGYSVIPYNPWWTTVPFVLPHFVGAKPTILHTSADYAAFFAKRGRPLVATFHNYVLDAPMRRFSTSMQRLHYATDLRAFTRRALKVADVVTAVSRATASLIRDDLAYKGELRVIENGVDTDLFRPSSSRRERAVIHALFSGNFSWRKGAQWLPEIARLTKPQLAISCVGMRSSLTSNLEQAGINIIQPVIHSEMPGLYQEADILLMPTVREGMSLAALEAMACGLPIVTTNCPSMAELVDDGIGGYLCPLGDTEAMAERLRWLAQSASTRAAMGKHNREKVVAQFNRAFMVDRYRELFDALV